MRPLGFIDRVRNLTYQRITAGNGRRSGVRYLQIVILSLAFSTLSVAENLPEFIEVDVSELKLGNSIMQKGLALPEGVELSNTLLTGQDQPVVSCTTTRASLEIEEEVEGEISEAAQDEEDSKEESSDTDKGAEEDNS